MKFVSNDYVDKIIKKLRKKEEFTKLDFIDLNKELNSTKLQGTKIKYGYLSKCIRDMSKEVRDNVHNSAEICMEFDIPEENDILIQVINHIILEVPRANDFDTLHEQSKNYNNKFREYNKDQKDFANRMANFESKFGNIQGEFIGILSIFAAVIIGFFGGLNVIGSAMQNMGDVSKYRIVFVILVLGLVMFNVIYMLLREVSKLAGKEKDKELAQCKNCKNKKPIICAKKKHSHCFYFNIFSILGLLLTYGLYLIDEYNVIYAILKLWKHTRVDKAFIPVIGLFIASIVLGMSLFIFKKVMNKIENSYNLECISNKSDNDKRVNQTDLVHNS